MPFFCSCKLYGSLTFLFIPNIWGIGPSLRGRVVLLQSLHPSQRIHGGNHLLGDPYVQSASSLLQSLQGKEVNLQHLFDFMDYPGPWFSQIRKNGQVDPDDFQHFFRLHQAIRLGVLL